MIKITGYLAAPIRGTKGDEVSQEEMDENISIGKRIGLQLKTFFGTALDLYVPHEQDEVLQILLRNNKVSTLDVLEADCEIVEKRDILFVLDKGETSEGMWKEICAAKRAGISIIFFKRINDKLITKIYNEINEILLKRENKDE
ncbi:MAG: hypothetical protein ACTSUP_00395 [Candidatus Heimdallarchaeaceae archaeon]